MLGAQSLACNNMQISSLSKALPYIIRFLYFQGSQLSKELVFSHSYIPKRLPANPLGIYPRRPINSRAKGKHELCVRSGLPGPDVTRPPSLTKFFPYSLLYAYGVPSQI